MHPLPSTSSAAPRLGARRGGSGEAEVEDGDGVHVRLLPCGRRLAAHRARPRVAPVGSRLGGAEMKITAFVVLKPSAGGAGGSSSSGGQGSKTLVLANATDVSHFGFFRHASSSSSSPAPSPSAPSLASANPSSMKVTTHLRYACRYLV
ncbi:uncharacterized protein LOC125534436 [Triticum urartu]|uniref:uncharacterized protein LOC125534436 n=1 Tax=Triticum urartu TaxID=4572 RepID=UPI002044289C|nr:uncharacterized protein LOC125534436 [Triticum urartu]